MTHPFIECDEHEGPQRSIIVCTHVLRGAGVAHYQAPTDQDSGEALCGACAATDFSTLMQGSAIAMICELHFRSMHPTLVS